MAVEKLRSNECWKHFLRELKRLDAYNQFLSSSKFYQNPTSFEENIIKTSLSLSKGYTFLSPKSIINWDETKEGWDFWNNVSKQIGFNKF